MNDEPIDPKLHELLTELEYFWNQLLKAQKETSENASMIRASETDPLRVMETVLGKILIDLYEVVKTTGFVLEVFEESNNKTQGISLEELLSNCKIQLLDDWKDPDKHKGKDDDNK